MDPTRTTYLRHKLGNENIPPPQPNRKAPKHRSDSIRNQSHKTLPHQNATPNLLHPTRQTHTFPLTTNAHPSSPPPRHPVHPFLPCRTMTSRHRYTALAQRADDMQSSSPPPSHLHQIVQYLHETPTMHTRYVVVSSLKLNIRLRPRLSRPRLFYHTFFLFRDLRALPLERPFERESHNH